MEDELDWTSVQDARDRKKIQNRMAQRRRRTPRRCLLMPVLAYTNRSTGQKLRIERLSGAHSITSPLSPSANDPALPSSPSPPTPAEPSLSPAVQQINVFDDFLLNLSPDSVHTPAGRESSGQNVFPWPESARDMTSDSSQFMVSPPSSSIRIEPESLGICSRLSTHDGLQRALADAQVTACEETQAKRKKPVSLEERFESVLTALGQAGFVDFDDMITQYYTSTFAEHSAAFEAQRLSRTRRLRGLLTSLSTSASAWPEREKRSWADAVVEAAESAYVDEARGALADQFAATSEQQHQGADRSASAKRGQPWMKVLERWLVDAEDPAADRMRHKSSVREQLPELWSLLSQIVSLSGLPQPQAVDAVYTTILILLGI